MFCSKRCVLIQGTRTANTEIASASSETSAWADDNGLIVCGNRIKNGVYTKWAWSAASTRLPDARSIQLTNDSTAAVNTTSFQARKISNKMSLPVLQQGKDVGMSECLDLLFYYWGDQEVGLCRAQAHSNNRDLALSTTCRSDQSGSSAGHPRFWLAIFKIWGNSGTFPPRCWLHFQWAIYNGAMQPATTYLAELITHNQAYQERITVMVFFQVFTRDKITITAKMWLPSCCRPELDGWESQCTKNH